MADRPNPDIPEGLELRKDGTVVLHLDDDNGRGQRTQLRRPKMKELRRLREEEWEIADEIRAFMAPLQQAVDDHLQRVGINVGDAKSLADASTDDLRILRDLQRDRDQKSTVRSEDLRGPWAIGVIDLLGGKQVEEDDLPPWAFTSDFAAQLLTHWVTVPTRRGSP